MRAKMNRYDLSLWDVGKRQLYGRKIESVQAATLSVALWKRLGGLHFNQDGIKRGGVA
jgi:hypothetical protein